MATDHEECPSPSNFNRRENIPLRIAPVTGQTWIENVSHEESVQSLKNKIWKRCGVLPYHQGLIFVDKSLPDNNEQVLLRDFGIRENSLIRLVLVTRSGPMSIQHSEISARSVETEAPDESCSNEFWDGERVFSEDFLEENRRTLFKMCELRRQMRSHASLTKPDPEYLDSLLVSAPEDTSAKESSAGDTECDDERTLSNRTSEKVPEVVLSNGSKVGGRRERCNSTKGGIYQEDPCSARDTSLSARNRLLVMMHSRAKSPSTDLNAFSEDGSEFSSGMIICDLTNEFRRLRVRRKHHLANGANTAQKTHIKNKAKPTPFLIPHRHKGSDLTSSDDERPSLRRSPDHTYANTRRIDANASYSSFRRPSAYSRGQRGASGCSSQHRCYTCASKFNNYTLAFHCRCGKKLCSRHRPAEMHTCPRLRKMQDVSD